jgi:hypothetical protein
MCVRRRVQLEFSCEMLWQGYDCRDGGDGIVLAAVFCFVFCLRCAGYFCPVICCSYEGSASLDFVSAKGENFEK